ncbi:MAG: RNA polymerase sigma factor, partial [Planctomycetota bacterium]
WIDHYRAQKPRGRLYSLDQAMLKGEPVLGHAQRGGEQRPAAMDALIQEEEKDRLREALCCLTEPHRLVFELAVYQQLPYAEIARVLEIPVGTVKSRMHNSVRALRREMHVGGGHKGVAQRPFRGRLTGGGAG